MEQNNVCFNIEMTDYYFMQDQSDDFGLMLQSSATYSAIRLSDL